MLPMLPWEKGSPPLVALAGQEVEGASRALAGVAGQQATYNNRIEGLLGE